MPKMWLPKTPFATAPNATPKQAPKEAAWIFLDVFCFMLNAYGMGGCAAAVQPACGRYAHDCYMALVGTLSLYIVLPYIMPN